MTESLLSRIQSPFQKLRGDLDGIEPGATPIDMTVGEPRHGFPAFAAQILAGHWHSYGQYPPSGGIDNLKQAIASWIGQRYGLKGVDPETHVLALNGTREGLVSALTIAVTHKGHARPVVLMPNPFYFAYLAAAFASGVEPVFLPSDRTTGFLPDLDALSPDLLERTAAIYLASPANPQGAVASASYLADLIALARRYGFYVFSDECYSEIYTDQPPLSALQCAEAPAFDKVVVFNSLSKRSNAPGLRSGFVAGDPGFIKDFFKFRNVAAPQIPIPIQFASAALWADESHVEESRSLYRAKFIAASDKLSALPGYRQPAGGFFLWLDVSKLGGGEAAAKTIWKGCGVKILPGAYLAQPDARGANPARDYARLALVDPLDITREALDRLASVLL